MQRPSWLLDARTSPSFGISNGMLKKGGDFIEIGKGIDKISLLEEELVQLMKHLRQGEWDMGYKNVILSRWGKGTKRAKISRNIELSKMGEGGKGGRNLEVQFSATVHHLVDDRALEESLPNIVTNNLRRDLGDSNMVSSPLIEGISTKLGDYFESTVADVRMDFEIREG
ncbi:hypothetical protein PVK06_004550 [Gossypium arboreum]|uniref:Uncharacterized protein n=1 Tax=Gossypium arboreum TaxID=29729 RepID=A0ABR0QSA7_GOSAR|nr:hypothetical protein PVK06_004550 [Gossypium arboreum]